jgi:succinate dehydrogenase/fumarate reductase flavoprotein subunit
MFECRTKGEADMKHYDVIVIGGGAGLEIVFKALSFGLRVALVEKGKVGGTCRGAYLIDNLPTIPA